MCKAFENEKAQQKSGNVSSMTFQNVVREISNIGKDIPRSPALRKKI